MPGYVIGLDLGRRCVKAAVLRGSFRGYEVEDFLSLEPEQPADGSLPTDEAVYAAAKAILDTVGQPQATVVVALPGGRVSTWLLDMPFSDSKRLEATLPFEVENYVPWDLDTVVLSYQVLAKGPPARVFAAMAPRDRVRALLGGLSAAGVDPRYVTVDFAALSGLLTGVDLGLSGPREDGGVAGIRSPVILDIGATRTLVSVCPDGQPRWLRSLDRGTELLARFDGGDDGLDPLDEEAMQAVALRQGKRDKLLRAFLADVRATLLAAQEGGFAVEQVYLCGGGARRAGLAEALSESLGLPVAELPMPAGQVNQEGAPRPEVEHALAYALARRAFVKGSNPLDFRKEEFAWQADSRLYARLALAGVAALVLLVVGGLGLHFVEVARLKGELTAQHQLLLTTVQGVFPEVPAASVASDRQAIAVMQEKLLAVEGRVESLRGHPITPLDGLKFLSELVPSTVVVDLEEFIVNDEMIRIRGETDSFQAVDTIEAAIQARPGWQSAEKSDVSKTREGKMRFVVTIPRVAEAATDEETEG